MTDVLVIGSGFGGTFAAHALLKKGANVIMLERGDWVTPQIEHNFFSIQPTQHYQKKAYLAKRCIQGACYCVGGHSLVYGAVSFRFREEDFLYDPKMSLDGSAKWPITYNDLEPFYQLAEELLQVSGSDENDPTRPNRKNPYPESRIIENNHTVFNAGKKIGFSPIPLPLSMHFEPQMRKNNLGHLLKKLCQEGLVIKTQHVVRRLIQKNDAIYQVEVIDIKNKKIELLKADIVVLAAGTLASAQILLNSKLENPAAHCVGRYLMRHCNSAIYGMFRKPFKEIKFYDKVAFLDLYFEHLDGSNKLGCIQELCHLDTKSVDSFMRLPIKLANSYSLQLLTIAEDQSSIQNSVFLTQKKDLFGLPLVKVQHSFTKRDKKANVELNKKAARILKEAGAFATLGFYMPTLSHAVGTVRMGEDSTKSPLDQNCLFRGLKNLYVTDGSVFPTSAGVNPSLTIAANALRVASLVT